MPATPTTSPDGRGTDTAAPGGVVGFMVSVCVPVVTGILGNGAVRSALGSFIGEILAPIVREVLKDALKDSAQVGKRGDDIFGPMP